MSCSVVLFSLFLMSPCGESGGSDISDAAAAAVSNPRRPAEDLERDAGRKPAQVLSFFNIAPGMTVLDLFSGGGYYTELLSSLVGADGKVIAHTNEAYIPFVGEIYQRRYALNRLANVEKIVSEADDLTFEDNSLDAAILVLTWHDFLYADAENGWNAIDETLLLNKLCAAMKPGASLGLIDHVADSGGDPTQIARALHRVDPQVVRDAIQDTCFRLDAEADFLLDNPDDHSKPVFDQSVRGKTDRFVFRFIRD